jgi:hypothetical protein
LAASIAVAVSLLATACGSDDGGGEAWVGDIRAAIEAVEAELGAGQEYFEVTASRQITNVFVAIQDGTVAVPYVYLDGELQPPAPSLTGTSGFTFTADAVDFDEGAILDRVSDELPEATIDTLSVEGGEGGTVRYVVSARSEVGGVLDVVVGPDGSVLAVDPL